MAQQQRKSSSNKETKKASAPRMETKATMTEVSMMGGYTKASLLKPRGKPRRRADFAQKDKLRQSNLTDLEVKLARRVWQARVEPVRETFGALVFDGFFGRYPRITRLFLRLDCADGDRPASDDQLRAARMAGVMERFSLMMEYIDQPERLTKLMTRMGIRFAKLEFEPNSSALQDLQDVLIDTIRMVTKDQLWPQEEEALRKCFELAFSIMEEASFTYYDLFIATQPVVRRSRATYRKLTSP